MRRSFGAGSGGMGGGGGMLRTVHRAVRAGGVAAQESFSHSTTSPSTNTNTTSTTTAGRSPTYKPTTSNALSLSSPNSNTPSPFSNSFNLPLPATWASCSSPTCSDEFEWECIDGSHEDERTLRFNDDHFVFGSVPTVDEVQHAVSSLQQVLDPAFFSQLIKDRAAYDSDKDVSDQTTSPTGFARRVPSVGSEVDWMEPSLQLCYSRMLKPHGSDRVYDAFHLLQTEPSVQRMVISLSSDKAVWDAVLNNEVVRELRESLDEADKNVDGSSDEGSVSLKAATDILSWIFITTRAKVMELIDKITKLVDELFQRPESEKKKEKVADSFEEKLRTSFLLSVVVFLIVVVTRAQRA